MIALHLLSPAPTAGSSTPRTSKPLALPYLPPAIPHSRGSSSSVAGASSWHSLDTLLQPTRLDLPSFLASNTIVHTTARPALVPYVDPLALQATRFFLLFYHMLSPRAASTVRLDVPMAEDLSFSSQRRRGASSSEQQLPESLLLEVQAGQGIQVYEARVTLVARLKGLRGFMYRWKVTAFVVATGAFWAGEMMILACAVVAVGVGLGERWEGVKREDDYEFERMSSGEEDDGKGAGRHKKRERDRDGERRVKAEVAPSSASDGKGVAKETIIKEEVAEREMLAKVPPLETGQSTEADDEAEMEPEGPKKGKGKVKEVKLEGGDELEDAGIGTSYSDRVSKEGARRRKNVPS
ncbi:putative adipose-regulatory protein-domain-containing protein [Corynascus novoguineensis]|uniref:Adipose-regulatory protein-domain-containing protein n=1 Tax=Corynascus novoguineensis TaxID=1126955 RepID=A0AAN7CWU5_9PEZI|nr:putative adipose-regulatory protein-domain-containing protein [Corynascus novoguineensis]